jgi:hypothetical protein
VLRADQGPERGAIVTSGRNRVKYLDNKICLPATFCALSAFHFSQYWCAGLLTHRRGRTANRRAGSPFLIPTNSHTGLPASTAASVGSRYFKPRWLSFAHGHLRKAVLRMSVPRFVIAEGMS